MGRRLRTPKKAQGPEEITFRTKPEIALELWDQARAWGIRHAGVVADADSGDHPNVLAGWERRRPRYGVAVRADFTVASSRTAPAQRTEALQAGLPCSAWPTVRWREGSPGGRRGRFAAVRCGRVTSKGRRRLGGLIGERPGRGPSGKAKSHGSNFGSDAALATMVESAHRRPGVERSHEEAQGLLGWDQDPGRLGPGFPRHAVSVMRASRFLVGQEWPQGQERRRRGRTRRPFSPRPDRRRVPLPEGHRQVIDWRRREAIRELAAKEVIAQFQPKLM